MWPFRRRRDDPTESPPADAPDDQRPFAAEGEWRSVPPIDRTLPVAEPVLAPSRFEQSLTTRAPTAVVQRLSHAVSADAPSGTVSGLLTIRAPAVQPPPPIASAAAASRPTVQQIAFPMPPRMPEPTLSFAARRLEAVSASEPAASETMMPHPLDSVASPPASHTPVAGPDERATLRPDPAIQRVTAETPEASHVAAEPPPLDPNREEPPAIESRSSALRGDEPEDTDRLVQDQPIAVTESPTVSAKPAVDRPTTERPLGLGAPLSAAELAQLRIRTAPVVSVQPLTLDAPTPPASPRSRPLEPPIGEAVPHAASTDEAPPAHDITTATTRDAPAGDDVSPIDAESLAADPPSPGESQAGLLGERWQPAEFDSPPAPLVARSAEAASRPSPLVRAPLDSPATGPVAGAVGPVAPPVVPIPTPSGAQAARELPAAEPTENASDRADEAGIDATPASAEDSYNFVESAPLIGDGPIGVMAPAFIDDDGPHEQNSYGDAGQGVLAGASVQRSPTTAPAGDPDRSSPSDTSTDADISPALSLPEAPVLQRSAPLVGDRPADLAVNRIPSHGGDRGGGAQGLGRDVTAGAVASTLPWPAPAEPATAASSFLFDSAPFPFDPAPLATIAEASQPTVARLPAAALPIPSGFSPAPSLAPSVGTPRVPVSSGASPTPGLAASLPTGAQDSAMTTFVFRSVDESADPDPEFSSSAGATDSPVAVQLAAGPAAPAGAPGAAGAAGDDPRQLDELARRLWGRMRLQLRNELRLERERAGGLHQR